jgi:TetR/AcrR family transcriptional repressor of nem operon
VKAASALFRQHGIDGISIADIMKAAGLTHGGFYGHFASKDELAAEAFAYALRERWGDAASDAPSRRSIGDVVRRYLSPDHRRDLAHGCPIAALGSDMVRQPRTVRHAFTTGARSSVDRLRRLMPGRSAAEQRRQALATAAGLVGALILSRAVDDPVLSDEILAAASTAFARPGGH